MFDSQAENTFEKRCDDKFECGLIEHAKTEPDSVFVRHLAYAGAFGYSKNKGKYLARDAERALIALQNGKAERAKDILESALRELMD